MRHQIEHRSRSQYLEIRLIRQIKQSAKVRVIRKNRVFPKKTTLGNSTNPTNETSTVTSEKSNSVEHLRQSTISESRALSNNRPFARPGHMVQKLHILVSKLHSGTSKIMHLPLFWTSHCATCSPVYIILYHVTGSCKGPTEPLRARSLVDRCV